MSDDQARSTVETLIAEKLQTVLHRGDANTRPRDFYDLYMLHERGDFNWDILREAVVNTFRNRHSESYLVDWKKIVTAVASSTKMQKEWARYRASAKYARELNFASLITAVEQFFKGLAHA